MGGLLSGLYRVSLFSCNGAARPTTSVKNYPGRGTGEREEPRDKEMSLAGRRRGGRVVLLLFLDPLCFSAKNRTGNYVFDKAERGSRTFLETEKLVCFYLFS